MSPDTDGRRGVRARLRTLDARWVPRAAVMLRRALAAGRAVDVRAARRGGAARRALAPNVLTAGLVVVLLAGAASALDVRDDQPGASSGMASAAPSALGPPLGTPVETWRVAVTSELLRRAEASPTEMTLALVVPGQPWTPEQAADALAGRTVVEPLTAVVREPGQEERQVGVRVLPADLAEQLPSACACATGLLVRAPLWDLASLAGRPDVLAVQPAPRGTTEPTSLLLRTPAVA